MDELYLHITHYFDNWYLCKEYFLWAPMKGRYMELLRTGIHYSHLYNYVLVLTFFVFLLPTLQKSLLSFLMLWRDFVSLKFEDLHCFFFIFTIAFLVTCKIFCCSKLTCAWIAVERLVGVCIVRVHPCWVRVGWKPVSF